VGTSRTFPLIEVPTGRPGTIVTEAPADAPSNFSG